MKNLVFGIIGVVFAWLILGFITQDFDLPEMGLVIFGVILGFQIGKKQRTIS